MVYKCQHWKQKSPNKILVLCVHTRPPLEIEVIQICDAAEQDNGFEGKYVGFEVHEDFVEEDEVVHLVTTSMIKTVPEKYLNQFYINWQRTVFMWKVNIYLKVPRKRVLPSADSIFMLATIRKSFQIN